MVSQSYHSDVLIVGTGLAGLFAALQLSPLKVSMISAAPLMSGASSAWAQGGIAAALSEEDTIQAHSRDTMIAGCFLNDPAIVDIMTSEAALRVHDLMSLGIKFDIDASGNFIQGREAAHSFNRIVRVGGDGAGRYVIEKLTEKVLESQHIKIKQPYVIFDFARDIHGTVKGVYVRKLKSNKPILLTADHIILATGGIGSLYQVTTNPHEIRGEGLGITSRHGATIKDAEFVQFHPTALNIGKTPAPLITEALRGEGGSLVNNHGIAFMQKIHAQAELAPRDIVARSVAMEYQKGNQVFLDMREALGVNILKKFPIVSQSCLEAGIDPVTQLIPVKAAQHYHMGGIAVDSFGRTSLKNLYAIGEVARTGAHGANRLASNSLLEALVFSARTAEFILNKDTIHDNAKQSSFTDPIHLDRLYPKAGHFQKLREIMSNNCGILRDKNDLESAQRQILQLDEDGNHSAPFTNYAHAALEIIKAALLRKESIGAHFRTDEVQKIRL